MLITHCFLHQISKQLFYKLQLTFFVLLIFSNPAFSEEENFKPFVLSEKTNLTMAKAKVKIEKLISQSPFDIVAQYSPYDEAYIYVISSDELKTLSSEVHYGGFAAPQRISLTKIKNIIQISYTNPVYMQYAFRMRNVDLSPILEQMKQAFGFKQFFGGKGLSARKLKRYRYSFGLEDFDSFYELPEYSSHKKALEKIRKGLNEEGNGISLVYELKIPGKKQVIFGIAMNPDDTDEEALDIKKTMSIIDYLPLKRTAYLPYEIMVDNKKIIALHARFRIAAYFYDLKMFGKHGFGKLLSTPGAYQEVFFEATGGVNENTSSGGDGFIN